MNNVTQKHKIQKKNKVIAFQEKLMRLKSLCSIQREMSTELFHVKVGSSRDKSGVGAFI